MEKERRKELMAKEIMRKGSYVNYESLDLAGGLHISCLHIGLTEDQLRARRKEEKKPECSSFKDVNAFNICIDSLFGSERFAEMATEWIFDPKKPDRHSFVKRATECIGMVAKQNGAVKKTSYFKFVLQRKDPDYRNKVTGLPFDLVTAMCVDPER